MHTGSQVFDSQRSNNLRTLLQVEQRKLGVKPSDTQSGVAVFAFAKSGTSASADQASARARTNDRLRKASMPELIHTSLRLSQKSVQFRPLTFVTP
jgi:hypothetical protein